MGVGVLAEKSEMFKSSRTKLFHYYLFLFFFSRITRYLDVCPARALQSTSKRKRGFSALSISYDDNKREICVANVEHKKNQDLRRRRRGRGAVIDFAFPNRQ